MNNKIIYLMCLLMAMIWTAGCSCPGVRPPVVPAPPVAEYVPPPAPRPVVTPPMPVEPCPSKKLKERVYY